MLNCTSSDMNLEELLSVIEKRMKWYKGESIDI